MINPQTIDELNRYARSGSFGALGIVLEADATQPVAGCSVRISWDASAVASTPKDAVDLRWQGQTLRVPVKGSHNIAAGAEPFGVEAACNGMTQAVHIAPRVTLPAITRFAVPPHARIGEPFNVSWATTQARSVGLSWTAGGQDQLLQLPPSGQRQICLEAQGQVTLRLVVASEHAALTPLATRAATAVVKVQGRRPVFTLPMPRQLEGLPGALVVLAYQVRHADKVVLKTDHFEFLLPEKGALVSLQVLPWPYIATLLATGQDGGVAKHLCEVAPAHDAIPEALCDAVDQPLEWSL